MDNEGLYMYGIVNREGNAVGKKGRRMVWEEPGDWLIRRGKRLCWGRVHMEGEEDLMGEGPYGDAVTS